MHSIWSVVPQRPLRGNYTFSSEPNPPSLEFALDESLLEKVTYANGVSQSLTYDLAGNVTGETDAEGNVKQYEYDPVGRLVAVVDELGNTTTYAYDALDNIAKVTDALGHVTEYTYDKNSNLTSETDALGNRVSYAYTPEGWLSAVTKADGAVLTYEYDKTGGLLTQNVGDGRSISSSYNELGMVTEVTSAEGTIVYQYNEQGYLVSVTNVNGDVVSYAYDAYGNQTAMTYPDGRKVTYEYDGMNRMTSVTGLDGEVTSYTYDAASRRIETSSSNLTTKYRFDTVGNLLEQVTSGASEIAFAYSYNKNGYITGEVRTENGQTTENTYAYDALGQLTSFLQSTGYGESYAYDAAGNMTEKVVTGTDGAKVALAMSYNAGNQLVSMANGGDAISYSYDANGSMVQKILTSEAYGTLTDAYTYDGLDQLTGYVGYDGYQQEFAYDANGMRLSKRERGEATRSTLEELLRGNIAGLPEVVQPTETVPEEYAWATTEYLYDITQEYYQVIQETTTSASGSTTTAYAYGLERIAAYSADSTTSYVYDGRGSVAQTITAPMAGDAVTSALPDVTVQVQSFAYTAYGEQMGAQKVSGFAYNAEAYDATTGMQNLRARQYEPVANRFALKDALRGNSGAPLTQNRYIYCLNDPENYIDPSGMQFVCCTALRDGGGGGGLAVTSAAQAAESTADAINSLKAAMQDGFASAANSTSAAVKKAYLKAKRSIDKRKSAGKEVSVEEENKLFKRVCTTAILQMANEYGKNNTEKLSASYTKNMYEYARYSNYASNETLREKINNNRNTDFPTSIIASKPDNPMCAGYIYNIITLLNAKLKQQSDLSKDLKKLRKQIKRRVILHLHNMQP